ncbi:TPM domain-containing protein [Jiella pacifica]|uniref:TPM domain-containing protein n=1 Tax=Jiella pacifica TaxID=2696469 RepID=A0A6N9T754_9HYPH|nr:TPM domain-containing protein [Jiella pacifica]NDW07244.1 TPM domain-containing protein [Jiella pacifica]
MAKLTFTEADHACIASAIGKAEAATTGEIYAVFTHASDGYGFVAATAALGLSLLAALTTAIVALGFGIAVPALGLILCQLLAAGLLGALLALFPRLRMIFVPRTIAASRAHAFALGQFAAHGLHLTADRTGVLIFVSEAEHHAEIVADAGIAAKVPQEAWDAAVAGLIEAARQNRLADGYVTAVTTTGAILASHFPGDAKNANELPDRLVVM